MINLSHVRIYTMINSGHERISANDKPKSCEDLYYDKLRS